MTLDSKKNNAGLAMLRVLAMVGITLIHLIGRSEILYAPDISRINYWTVLLLDVIVIPSTNLFGLISGYFLYNREFKIKRICNVWAKAFSVGIILLLLAYVLGIPVERITLVRSVFPVLGKHYWYIFTYIMVLAISPILNKIIADFTKNQLKWICIGGAAISLLVVMNPLVPDPDRYVGGSWGVPWMSYMYILGAYVHKYGIENKTRKYFYLFGILSVLGIFALRLINLAFIEKFFGISSASSPKCNSLPSLLISFGLFLALENSRMKGSRFINYISGFSLYVYLFQEHWAIRDFLWDKLNIVRFSDSLFCIVAIAMDLVIVWICAWILYLVSRYLEKPLLKLAEAAMEKIKPLFAEK